jgi:tetratricopeptide (TPR) repeat protein
MQRRRPIGFLSSWIWSSLVVLAIPVSLFGQGTLVGRKEVSGYIRLEGSGQLLKGAHIQILNPMGTPEDQAYSDGNGAYEFDDLGPGDFYIVVELSGYTAVREFVRPDGSPHVYKDVFLRPVDPEATSKSASPISKHELSAPRKAREDFAKGLQLIVGKNDYRGAINQFSRAIECFPDYYEAYAAMGLAQYKIGDTVAAEKSFKKSITMSGEKYPQAMIDLASMLNELKRYSEAEPVLHKLVAADGSSWRAQYELAVALAGREQFKEAVTSATAARDLKPDNPQVYLLLYNLHIQSDDFPGALRDTDDYLKLSSEGATADRVRLMREQVEKALQKPAEQTKQNDGVSLKIALRLADNSPFDGEAALRLLNSATSEAKNTTTGPDGDAVFPDVQPGNYALEASAPGFATVKQNIAIQANQDLEPLILTMKLEAAGEVLSSASSNTTSRAKGQLPAPGNAAVIPARVDEAVPEVAVAVPCSLPSVLKGAGQRAQQLLTSLQKFAAAERVEHYKVTSSGMVGAPEVSSFDYVMTVSLDGHGGFQLQEFRNGKVVTPRQFPSGIVTANLAAHGLIFHPSLAPGFNFSCEGLGQWKGRPTWLVHFEEKPNQRNPFRSYEIEGVRYPLQLTGRAWIDAENYQILRLESDLAKPIEKIHLKREHIAIEFASVQFRSRAQRLWLPQTAELYVEFGGHRFYRKHQFSDFKLFSTDTSQAVDAPKEAYCFTNTSGLLITGILDATPVSGKAVKPASLTISIPAKATVCKSVGSGKDVNIPVEYLASTTFAHDGPAGSVEADAYQLDAGALEIIPNKNVASRANR